MHINKNLVDKSRPLSTFNKSLIQEVDIDIERAQSIYDKIADPTLGLVFIKLAIDKLGFAKVADNAQFACNAVQRQGGHKGKLFVSLCHKEMNSIPS